MSAALLFCFRKEREISVYGLHNVLPQFVVVGPSARTTVGTTKVLRNRTAAPRMSSMRFMVFSPCDCELDRDNFMAQWQAQWRLQTFERSEFVTR